MKEIVGFPMYTLSRKGEVYSKYSNKIMCNTVDTTGYPVVVLTNKDGKFKKSIHRLLAQKYISNPEDKPQVNHKDFDKSNYSLSNLEWVTSKENCLHARINGLLDDRDSNRCFPVVQIDPISGLVIQEYARELCSRC